MQRQCNTIRFEMILCQVLRGSSQRCPPLRLTLSSSRHVSSATRIHREVQTTDEFKGMTGAEIFVNMVRKKGVSHIFGYPGGAILPVFDAIYGTKDLDFILARHEQGAGGDGSW